MKNEEKREEANKPHMKVFTSPPKIVKVKLTSGGRKGAVIGFNDCVSTNGVGRQDYNDKTIYVPVPKSLRVCFDMLREYLLENFSYSWSNETEKEMLLANVTCTYAYYDQASDKFALGGQIKYKKTVENSLNGQKLQLSGYDFEDEIRDIFKRLFHDAELFLAGVKTADTKQIVADYLHIKKGMENPEEEFENMTKQEKDDFIMAASKMYGLELVEEDGNLVITAAADAIPQDEITREIKERVTKSDVNETVMVLDEEEESPSFEETSEFIAPPDLNLE